MNWLSYKKRLFIATGIAALLIAAGSGILLAAGHAGQQSSRRTSASVATTTEGSTATYTASSIGTASNTHHPTATATRGTGGNTVGGAAPISAPGAGQIKSATLTVDHSSFSGVCSDAGEPFVFTLTVTVTPHITSVVEVDFQWQGNAVVGGGLPTPTLLFAGEETTKTVTVSGSTFGSDPNGADSWLAAQIEYPVSLTTNQAHFSVNCTPSLADLSVQASSTDWSGACGNYQEFRFDYAVHLAPMSSNANPPQSLPWTMATNVPNDPAPKGTTTIWHPYPYSGTAPVLFGGVGTKVVGFASFYLYVHLTDQDANGSYWITVTVNGPNNSSVAKTVTITKNCN